MEKCPKIYIFLYFWSVLLVNLKQYKIYRNLTLESDYDSCNTTLFFMNMSNIQILWQKSVDQDAAIAS